jgi:phosphate transport system protein
MTRLESDIADLRQRVLTMASHAGSNLRQAIKALTERDDDYAARVENGDNILDAFEKEIDETAFLLLLRAPLARDLRLIMVATRIGHELERVGDEATAIARRVRDLNREPPLRALIDLPAMAHQVLEMLALAIDTFVTGNPEQARLVISLDRPVDRLNRQFHGQLAALITRDVSTLSRALILMSISKRLERIGDHAKSIAEVVVYLSEARDIRHTQKPAHTAGAPGSP